MTVAERVLRDVVLNMPYSSASEFYRWLSPDHLDTAMGEVCVRQTMAVAQRLRTSGIEVDELFDGRHVAAVAYSEDTVSVLDPYLMHLEPLKFTRVQWAAPYSQRAVDGPTMWCGEARSCLPTRVESSIERAGADDWAVSTSLRFAGGALESPTQRSFRMSGANEFVLSDFESRIVALLLDPEQTSVSIRIVHDDLSGVTQAWLPLTMDGAKGQYRTDAVKIRSTSNSDSPEAWAFLARRTTRSEDQIRNYLVGAARLHADLVTGRVDIS